ncbi:MAG: hypothetical protein MnENMB40S_11670 [Rhizobiaceae bacterium MnEN-MB40S]|nr:MAG: hypothetical protein MnENMB40S_11670 [Rhizobiaceae bacterium MnEN-MB40S]
MVAPAMTEAVQFTFLGSLQADSFLEFATHRARRLDLGYAFGDCSNEAVSVAVEGAHDLVDAFEMACSLGPHDCIVLDVERKSGAALLAGKTKEKLA